MVTELGGSDADIGYGSDTADSVKGSERRFPALRSTFYSLSQTAVFAFPVARTLGTVAAMTTNSTKPLVEQQDEVFPNDKAVEFAWPVQPLAKFVGTAANRYGTGATRTGPRES
jgi:hypothetical protein